MGGVWVVVATSAKCRIFTQKAHAAPLEAVSEFDDPDARLKPGDMNTDRPGRFSRLVLVADPRFLGHLRHGLNPATRSRLTAEIGKNLAAEDPESIRSHLPYRL